ncbi:MAG: DNA polymerase III subunit gamma/tau [Lentimicrobium sp.]|nr:DNA polymerase III subunit gamma/tau [Lentimicrobium sp.]
MDSFIVSARKYRPATFATVVGQASITNTLKNAIRNQQIAQAFLFTGPRGVGKTTCARIMAKTINCENITPEGEACGTCSQCVTFTKSSSFNIYELDAASNNSVDDIRNLVDQVRIPPQSGKYKVYIIDEVHMLSASAFNAFLKTLEEPPAYAKFILATTEKHKIMPTILSRCQIFDFKRISVEDIAGHLAYVAENEHIEAEVDALHVIAQKADGALRDALSMFDQLVSYAGNKLSYKQVIENLNVLDHDYYFKITDYLLRGDISNSLLTLNEIIENGFEGQHFIAGLTQHLRDLLVGQDKETLKLLDTSANIRNQYLMQAVQCSAGFLLKALDLCNECDLNYRNSNSKRLHLEIALMQLCILANPNADALTRPAMAPLKPASSEPSKVTPPVTPAPLPPAAKVEEPVINILPKPVEVPPAEPVVQEKPVVIEPANTPPATISKSYTGLNVGNLMNQGTKNTINEPEEKQLIKEEVLPEQSEAFTQSDLEKVWSEMAVTVARQLPNLYATLTCRNPILNEDNSIVISVENKIQEGDIFNNRPELVTFLRKKLRNTSISIETLIIDKPAADRKPYTDTEKFEAMERNAPDIRKLKDQLNLDIEM